jgi:oxygen-independent coproporphyrinogen-3 oxidase
VIAGYPRLLARELVLRGHAGGDARLDTTIYIGGGTPSLLGPEGIVALFSALPPVAESAEVTMEVNPGDVTPALASAMRRCGVTRVSIGAQSFDNATLAFLGRRHTAEETDAAVSTLRLAGFTEISLDLIAAIPGTSPQAFRTSLEHAVALGPKHLSVYPLSLEEGTCFSREVAAGRLRPPTDDESLDSVAVAESILRQAGYGRYEISNYAWPGFECRHNLAVWRGEDYIGIGPAAASREGLNRRTNLPDLAVWMESIASGKLPPASLDILSPEDDERERFTTGLRLAAGRCSVPATDIGRERLAIFLRLEKLGLMERLATGAYALTPRGREVADAICGEF